MSLSAAIKSIGKKTPSEVKEETLKMYSLMTPERFFEHMSNLKNMTIECGRDREREEIVCRLLASGMTVDEITVILCVKKESISIIEHNNAAIKIPEYAKKLRIRRQRREKQAHRAAQL